MREREGLDMGGDTGFAWVPPARGAPGSALSGTACPTLHPLSQGWAHGPWRDS